MSEQLTTESHEYIRQSRRGGWRLSIWAQPGAKRSEVVGPYRQSLKVRLAAPAVDNEANKALVAFLARLLEIKPRHLTLESGHANRNKVLAVEAGCKPDFSRLEKAG